MVLLKLLQLYKIFASIDAFSSACLMHIFNLRIKKAQVEMPEIFQKVVYTWLK